MLAVEKYPAKPYRALVDKLQFCGQADRSIKNCDGNVSSKLRHFCTNYQLPSSVERIPNDIVIASTTFRLFVEL